MENIPTPRKVFPDHPTESIPRQFISTWQRKAKYLNLENGILQKQTLTQRLVQTEARVWKKKIMCKENSYGYLRILIFIIIPLVASLVSFFFAFSPSIFSFGFGNCSIIAPPLCLQVEGIWTYLQFNTFLQQTFSLKQNFRKKNRLDLHCLASERKHLPFSKPPKKYVLQFDLGKKLNLDNWNKKKSGCDNVLKTAKKPYHNEFTKLARFYCFRRFPLPFPWLLIS